MRQISWQVRFGISLVVISALLYLIHYGIFRDAYHLEIYGLGDIAFLPLEVLLVTLIIDQIITNQEKRVLLQKLKYGYRDVLQRRWHATVEVNI